MEIFREAGELPLAGGVEVRMELAINVVALAVVALVWTGLVPENIEADFDSGAQARLGALEEALEGGSADLAALRELTAAYLANEQPAAALGVLRGADPALLEHPALGHALARSYESLGRFDDALASARLTFDRCARSLGSSDGPAGTDVPRFRCSAREYAMLSVHQSALSHIVAWGVVRPGDARNAQAYDLAMRRARIASVE